MGQKRPHVEAAEKRFPVTRMLGGKPGVMQVEVEEVVKRKAPETPTGWGVAVRCWDEGEIRQC